MSQADPTLADLMQAEQVFLSHEPRDLFYRVAVELIELSRTGKTPITISEALAVLLQTWNQTYYRFHPDRRIRLADDLDILLTEHEDALERFRDRSIEEFAPTDEDVVSMLFNAFDQRLGSVGAAKAMHLLAPRFFPLWDDAIAKAYGLGKPKAGANAPRYVTFMSLARSTCLNLGGEVRIGRNPLKALDEFNYCKHSRGWI